MREREREREKIRKNYRSSMSLNFLLEQEKVPWLGTKNFKNFFFLKKVSSATDFFSEEKKILSH